MQLEHDSISLRWSESWDVACVHVGDGKPKANAETFTVRGFAFEAGLCRECAKASRVQAATVVKLPLAG